ncbi:hypothetical protein GW17_00055526, partial [Ensete ventricosum]
INISILGFLKQIGDISQWSLTHLLILGYDFAECPGACQYRCSKTAYKKPCLFFCQKCCFKCRCVPPGTYAHKEVCPCYNNWKTKRGGPKCP